MIAADLSELLKLSSDLAGAAVQADHNCAQGVAEVAPQILAEQQATVPVDTGELRDSLGIEKLGDADMRIGPLTSPGADHARFVEDGTVYVAPQPFIRPAGEKFAPELPKAVVKGPFWKAR